MSNFSRSPSLDVPFHLYSKVCIENLTKSVQKMHKVMVYDSCDVKI